MNIAIVHYHLGRGGVSKVIASHLRALESVLVDRDGGDHRVMLLFAGPSDEAFEILTHSCRALTVSLHRIDDLGYGASTDARELARSIRAVLLRFGGSGENTIVHVHNHSLGKNAALPGALRRLAEEQFPLLLQIHDFCEDFRPQGYGCLGAPSAIRGPDDISHHLYFQAPHVHYAVLNRRDHSILVQAGFDDARVHLLANPVLIEEPASARQEARSTLAEHLQLPTLARLVLYPVRGIRRKNLGEALLWSVLACDDTVFGFTLAPQNPVELPAYERWKRLVRELELPCAFELGNFSGLHLSDLLAAADRILTTSVAEGFGMVFLESSLAGRRLVGRDLPEVTADFRSLGLRFDWLRDRLRIPIDWIGPGEFRDATEGAYRRVLAAFGQPCMAPARLGRAIDALVEDGLVDFARLGTHHQARVIQAARGSIGARSRLQELNHWIGDALCRENGANVVDRNAEIVRKRCSLHVVGARLHSLYEKVLAGPRGAALRRPPRAERILGEFLDLHRFHPLRIE